MKLIGNGWQYKVYDLGNGRVRKLFRSKLSAYGKIIPAFPYRRYSVFEISKFVSGMREKAEYSITTVREMNIDPRILGNPIFVGDLDYEQDLAVPLNIYFRSLNEAAGKEVIESFIAFNRRLIALGIADKSFGIGTNFGMSAGNIILMDFGELRVGPEEISRHIGTRPWTRSYVINSVPKPLRAHFISRMDRAFE